jgi:hypothetical protein
LVEWERERGGPPPAVDPRPRLCPPARFPTSGYDSHRPTPTGRSFSSAQRILVVSSSFGSPVVLTRRGVPCAAGHSSVRSRTQVRSHAIDRPLDKRDFTRDDSYQSPAMTAGGCPASRRGRDPAKTSPVDIVRRIKAPMTPPFARSKGHNPLYGPAERCRRGAIVGTGRRPSGIANDDQPGQAHHTDASKGQSRPGTSRTPRWPHGRWAGSRLPTRSRSASCWRRPTWRVTSGRHCAGLSGSLTSGCRGSRRWRLLRQRLRSFGTANETSGSRRQAVCFTTRGRCGGLPCGERSAHRM